MPVPTILELMTFATSVVYLAFAFLQLILRNKQPLNYCLAALYLAGAYVLLYFWSYSTGFLANMSMLRNTEIIACFLIGPFFYLYFTMAIGKEIPSKSRLALHFLPFASALILILIFTNRTPASAAALPANRGSLIPDYSSKGFIRAMSLLSDIHMGIYMAFTILSVSIHSRKHKNERALKSVRIYLLLFLCSAIIIIASGVMKSIELALLGILCLMALPLYYSVYSFRNPEFSLRALKEKHNGKQKRLPYEKHETDPLIRKLKSLMDEEKIYRKDDLNLRVLSSRLNITPHELSHILNERLDINFRTFINSYRIDEAKKLLLESPDLSILDISLIVGFNSKSTFYSSFRKEMNCLPMDFRKK